METVVDDNAQQPDDDLSFGESIGDFSELEDGGFVDLSGDDIPETQE